MSKIINLFIQIFSLSVFQRKNSPISKKWLNVSLVVDYCTKLAQMKHFNRWNTEWDCSRLNFIHKSELILSINDTLYFLSDASWFVKMHTFATHHSKISVNHDRLQKATKEVKTIPKTPPGRIHKKILYFLFAINFTKCVSESLVVSDESYQTGVAGRWPS